MYFMCVLKITSISCVLNIFFFSTKFKVHFKNNTQNYDSPSKLFSINTCYS